jgi:hypothetical protein
LKRAGEKSESLTKTQLIRPVDIQPANEERDRANWENVVPDKLIDDLLDLTKNPQHTLSEEQTENGKLKYPELETFSDG